jgi:hypothetical protein
MTHDLNSYRKAKAILPQIEEMLHIFNLVERSLIHYESYTPAYKVLLTIHTQRKYLEYYYDVYKNIVKNKGLKNNNL